MKVGRDELLLIRSSSLDGRSPKTTDEQELIPTEGAASPDANRCFARTYSPLVR